MDTGRSVMCLEMWISSFKDNKTACSFMQMGWVEWRKHSYVLVGATTAWISTLWCQLLTAAALNNNLCVSANLHNLLLEKIVTLLLSGRRLNILWQGMLLAHVTGNNSYWSMTQPYLMNQQVWLYNNVSLSHLGIFYFCIRGTVKYQTVNHKK